MEQVNSRPAEPPEERPRFEDLTAVHPTERLDLPPALESVKVGKGSRVALAGGPATGATRLLREIAGALGSRDLNLGVVLVGVRPEEVTAWRREAQVSVTGGSFEASLEAQTQAASPGRRLAP